MPVDPSANRSSGFWSTLGDQFVKVAEFTIPQIGAAAATSLATSRGDAPPQVTTTPGAGTPGTVGLKSSSTFYVILAVLGFILVFASLGFRRRERR